METLPIDIMYNILLDTDFDDLDSLCKINKTNYSICDDRKFWIDKIIKDFGTKRNNIINSGLNPYLLYKIMMIIKSPFPMYPYESDFYHIGKMGDTDVIDFYLKTMNKRRDNERLIKTMLLGTTKFTKKIGNKASYNEDKITHIIKYIHDIDSNESREYYNWLLEDSIQNGNLSLVIYITQEVSRIFNVAVTLEEYYNYIKVAITYNHNDILKYLIKIHRNMISIFSILENAITWGNLDTIKLIVEEFILPFNYKVSKLTFNHYIYSALSKNKYDVAEYLTNTLNIKKGPSQIKKLFDDLLT